MTNFDIAIIMAGGTAINPNSTTPRVMASVMGKPMIGRVTDAAVAAKLLHIVAVVPANDTSIKDYLTKEHPGSFISAVEQEKPLGTAHAVIQAERFIRSCAEHHGNVLILNGDTPFMDANTICSSYAHHINAGNDLMEPGMQVEIDRIIAAVKAGEISQEQLDKNVRNMLTYIVKTPRFNKYQYSNKPEIEAHAKLVREAAPEGMVLLENNGVLPLQGVKKVALYGTGSYDFIAGGTGSGNVNKPYIRNVAEGLADNGFEVNQDIQKWYEQYIAYAKTTNKNNGGLSGVLLGEAVIPEMAVNRDYFERMEPQTDIAIFTLSRNAGEGGDRYAKDGDWTITGLEREMIQNLADIYHAAGKKFVVVLNIGGVIETASWKHIPDAILLAWTPGQEGGLAVADILSGKANPSGKLPMTFPVSYLDIPSSHNFPYNYKNVQTGMWDFLWGGAQRQSKDVDYTEYAEGIYVGYRYFQTANAPVSYPFGYGKSYTTFEYSKPVVKATADGFTATITVKNTGAVAGKEAVQLYVAAPAGGLEKPAFELKGFAKTKTLAPGEAQTLTINVDKYTLASFNEATSAWETAAGTYKVMFGADAADIRGTGEYKLKKAESWKVNNVLAPAQPINEMSLAK